jgi:hypothetical protein
VSPSDLLHARLASDLPATLWADRWAVLGGLAAGAVVVPLTYGLGRWQNATVSDATLAALAVATVWCMLAAPALAVGGRGLIRTLFRAGAVCDGLAVGLLILWPISPAMTFGGAARVYATLLAVVLLAAGAVDLGTSAVGRMGRSVMVAVALVSLAAGPFWVDGLARWWAPDDPRPAVEFACRLNPYYSITSAVVRQTRSVWHESGLLYRITWIGEDIPAPNVRWFDAAVRLGVVGLVLMIAGQVRRRPMSPSTRPPGGEPT